jgi:hypothetical protein
VTSCFDIVGKTTRAAAATRVNNVLRIRFIGVLLIFQLL